MYSIEVDLRGLQEVAGEIEPDLSILQQGIVEAAAFVRDTWVSAVQGTVLPGMSRPVYDDEYARSLSTGESMRFPAFLYGVVMPVNYEDGADRIENGFGAFDMKKGLLNGPKSRPLKNGEGRYNTVPFRHYTPRQNGATSISIRARMLNEVYRSVRKLNRSTMNPDGTINWGQALKWDAPPATSWAGYTHKSSIYEGMYRVGAEKQTQYLTFRRVSTPRTHTFTRGREKGQTIQLGSVPNSWMHPGVSPNPVIEAVYNACMPEVEKLLYAYAEKAFGIS